MPERLTLTVPEAARMIGCGRDTAYGLVRDGQLRSIRVGWRIIVPREAVEQFLSQGSQAAWASTLPQRSRSCKTQLST